LIAGAFFRRGIVEIWGRGTLKMMELTKAAGLPAPEFEATRHHVTVRFGAGQYVAPTRVGHDLTDLQRSILTALAQLGPASLSQLQRSLGQETAERTLQNNLQMLRRLGLVDLAGKRRASRWALRSIGSGEAGEHNG
jgi:ATP-dependent DNA helicase RecG